MSGSSQNKTRKVNYWILALIGLLLELLSYLASRKASDLLLTTSNCAPDSFQTITWICASSGLVATAWALKSVFRTRRVMKIIAIALLLIACLGVAAGAWFNAVFCISF